MNKLRLLFHPPYSFDLYLNRRRLPAQRDLSPAPNLPGGNASKPAIQQNWVIS